MDAKANVSSGRPVTVWYRRDGVALLDAAATTLGVTRSAFVKQATLGAAKAILAREQRDRVAPELSELERAAGELVHAIQGGHE
jgi:uncharacterized protein (DUF1778 family)